MELTFQTGHFVVAPLHCQDHLMDPRIIATPVCLELSQLEFLLSILSYILLIKKTHQNFHNKYCPTFILRIILPSYSVLSIPLLPTNKPQNTDMRHIHVDLALLSSILCNSPYDLRTTGSGPGPPSPEPSLILTKLLLIPLYNT